MNYKETVEYLFNSTPVFEHVAATAYKDGLDNSHALDAHFGHPHTRYQTIHVAGANGKGLLFPHPRLHPPGRRPQGWASTRVLTSWTSASASASMA